MRRAAVLAWCLCLRCVAMLIPPFAADLPCDCAQRDAGQTMALMQALPGDAVVALFAAMSASGT